MLCLNVALISIAKNSVIIFVRCCGLTVNALIDIYVHLLWTSFAVCWLLLSTWLFSHIAPEASNKTFKRIQKRKILNLSHHVASMHISVSLILKMFLGFLTYWRSSLFCTLFFPFTFHRNNGTCTEQKVGLTVKSISTLLLEVVKHKFYQQFAIELMFLLRLSNPSWNRRNRHDESQYLSREEFVLKYSFWQNLQSDSVDDFCTTNGTAFTEFKERFNYKLKF